jgi:hypothetical protein
MDIEDSIRKIAYMIIWIFKISRKCIHPMALYFIMLDELFYQNEVFKDIEYRP